VGRSTDAPIAATGPGDNGDVPDNHPDPQATRAYASLIRKDKTLRDLARTYGHPDPFGWEDGGRTGSSKFAALMLHIAGQQISTAVAMVIYDRATAGLGRRLDPAGVVEMGPERLVGYGMSHAKAAYMVGLAEMQLAGQIDVEHLDALTDDQVFQTLTSVRGIGRWSAEMFMIFQLHRPDVLPSGDLGIRQAVGRISGLATVPTIKEVQERGAVWAPWRTYAAALLWSSLGVR
jgi:DNA-3-methyladenine glycosylase II